MLKKLISVSLAGVLAVGLAACSSGESSNASSENYPERSITIVAPSGAGGGWDLTARSIAKTMNATKLVEEPITVENKPGGGGAVYMAEYATKEVDNDYMMLVKSPPILINNNKAEGNSPYGYKDTTPLAQLTRDYGAIVVKADSKFQSLGDVLEAIKADPKKVTLAGGSAPGSMDHLVGILPAFEYGIDPKSVKYVSYDGGGEAVAALLGGNADVIATDASTIAEYVKSGDVRVLAVSSPERLEGTLSEVPTFMEEGIDAEFTIWRGIFGPKNMSDGAKEYWTSKLEEMSASEEWKQELEKNGWQSEYKNSEDFTEYLTNQEKVIVELLTALEMQK
ncbi:tripartite tricarboxylate transporter substrate binding protein [Planococcus shenhongbingii]|uniref:Tripartite tricarboxylate transporter substrate binding protein n=1 Tax=Planococcus shenhongbingii TaxID=3058398 RepID=A0ABT8NAF4_9BACL|nr:MULTISPECIES: tripartite tricarboxylate transporter substrate binding protein [unclassified Planococcus (in: firmicutes)]MDN7244870.1 tripartite tricarboxylate transporter substrate binding protein [Planococcus sp. N017]WKA57987.1 tripartite tricarboxylate transporter substrate binding protein [Planococcus sp. N016]